MITFINTTARTLTHSLPTPSGITCLHVSASIIAAGTTGGHVKTYNILHEDGDEPVSLQLAQEHSFFSSSTAITPIQCHPILLSFLICTTNDGDVKIITLCRSKLFDANKPSDIDMNGHGPSAAWGAAWTPLLRKSDMRPLRAGQGTYTVGDDNKINNRTWSLTDDFFEKEFPDERHDSPDNIHEGLGITGVVNLMLPGLFEGRDILATTGRDGSVSIIDAFTNGLDDDGHTLEGGLVATLKVNQHGGTWGLKDIREPYVPDEGLEDELEEESREYDKFDRRLEDPERTKMKEEVVEDMRK